MSIAASTLKAEDDKDISGTQTEEYTANIAEVVYTVAPIYQRRSHIVTMITRMVAKLNQQMIQDQKHNLLYQLLSKNVE